MVVNNDTIAAIATPIGEGGISVVRVSGPHAISVASHGFKGRTRLEDAPSHTAHYGKFVDTSGNPADEVVALVFRSPHSYTGEDVVEISCHGGILVTRRILELLLEHGARHAGAGEFTKRAFLNGRIDLSQAEAVADLIKAKSDRAHESSMQQLEGRLSRRIQTIRSKLIEALGLLELELDFVEDHLEFIDKSKVAELLESTLAELTAMADTYKAGRVYREGLKVVLLGAPNVGKSSILNSLLNSDRAIVTDIPGTTRDVIEEALQIDGVLFRVVDTAGLRESNDPVEMEGMRRTTQQVSEADILLFVLDSSRPLDPSELRLAEEMVKQTKGSQRGIVVFNKSDLPTAINGVVVEKALHLATLPSAAISALTGEGMDRLKDLLARSAINGLYNSTDDGITVTNIRHYEALRRSSESLVFALDSLRQGSSSEFIAVDIRASLDSLGEIIGIVTNEEILNSIFSKFCIGK